MALPRSRASKCLGVYLANPFYRGPQSLGLVEWPTSPRKISHALKPEEQEAVTRYWATAPITTTHNAPKFSTTDTIILAINQLNAQKSSFIISLLYASTCFKHYVLIIRRSKLYYTASGINTLTKKVAFIQLLKLFGVHLLYTNFRIYRKCNLTVFKTCFLCRWPSRAFSADSAITVK